MRQGAECLAYNLPQIPDFDTKITAAAGRNIKFTLALQALQQLEKYYGLQAKTISGNCATWIYLSTGNPETQKILSGKGGQYTVRTDSFSSHSRRSSDYSHSVSDSLTGRPLLTPDEVGRWPKGRSLIFKDGQFPAQLPLPDLLEWPAAADLIEKESVNEEAMPSVRTEFWVPGMPGQMKVPKSNLEKKSARDAIDTIH